ncbi:hypothetical protein NFHSH190041_16730 [Shewanella sp. NFH-SH190041]|uniref:YtxH domain-containing protein n=1 Tax=Shewanella sp. NFH-SH190041 TaxID=2950245 RepID=UPI0021C3E5A0|nr:YtxH domain-containing protein [Shewanella sp. NFH-SH190041]BDM64221.1 hypothetical protein NFHSH190041_16730 [Shewanella sp. NFH-SH190041]
MKNKPVYPNSYYVPYACPVPHPGHYHGHSHVHPYYPTATPQQTLTTEKSHKSKTHFAMGIAAGAAVMFLLGNNKVRQGVTATGGQAIHAVNSQIEELKEKLEDTQAELEYYRNLHRDEA